ncbi:MAG: hypothetical protein JKY84_03645 [Emcibacteraceae bacterium]|nr:hypothetical protein [Emcibacteraceae bacterium]
MGDISGIFLAFILLFIIIFSPKLRSAPSSYKIIAFGFLIHLIIAAYNGFIGPTIGAGADATTFYRAGAEIGALGRFQFSLGSGLYDNLLGVMFYLFDPSMFLACVLSVAAYVASLFPLMDICKALKFEKFQKHIIAAYSFLPSMFLFGSIALRESLQVCFCIFAISYFIKFYSHRKISYFLIAVSCSALMGLLHAGLLLFALIMTVTVILMNYNQSNKFLVYSKSKLYTYFLLIVVIGVIISILPSLTSMGVVTTLIQGGDIADYTDTYRGNLVDLNPRSGYEIELDYSSPISFLMSIFKMILYYIAYPFPWKITAIIDIYACLEALWRCTLIYYSYKGWKMANGEIKKVLTLLIILYFANASIWAMGTSNFGTGMRHNLTHYWILTITGLPYLIISWRSFFNKYFFRVRSYL